MTSFTLMTQFECTDHIADVPLEEEWVLLNAQTGNYYELNSVAGDIWQLLKAPITLQTLLEKLKGLYHIEDAPFEEQVTAFIQLLIDKKLITAMNSDH